jgi:membrane-bound lytic murein transglycosylase B
MRKALVAAMLASSLVHAQDFDACVKELRAEAAAGGISAPVIDNAFMGLQPDPSVIEASENQPEFETPVWEYLSRLVDDRRVAEGREMLETWRKPLGTAERRYGVDRNFLVAVWGVETDYGHIMGRRSLVRSLATLSCSGPRQRYFRTELIAALGILQSGDVRANACGILGGRLRPCAVHAVHVPAPGGGSRRRRQRDIVGSIPDAWAPSRATSRTPAG